MSGQFDLANTDYNDTSQWHRQTNEFSVAPVFDPAAQPVTVAFADTVKLPNNYATPNYTVGWVGQETVDLQKGNVILDGATLYQYVGGYVGSGADGVGFSLTDANIQANLSNFRVIGGQGGKVYVYLGAVGNLSLQLTDYTDPALWEIYVPQYAGSPNQPTNVVSNYTALGGGATLSYNNPKTLTTGDTVTLDQTYDTPTYTVGAGSGIENLRVGNVILDGTTLYRYVGGYVGSGGDGVGFSLTDANIRANLRNFRVIGGISGNTYTYIGSGAQVDLPTPITTMPRTGNATLYCIPPIPVLIPRPSPFNWLLATSCGSLGATTRLITQSARSGT